MQFLSVRTMRKLLLQSLKRFRAQRILAGWASGGDGSLSSNSGGVGGSYEVFMVGYAKQDKRSRQYAHMDGWIDV